MGIWAALNCPTGELNDLMRFNYPFLSQLFGPCSIVSRDDELALRELLSE
jgi:hypothetical protein